MVVPVPAGALTASACDIGTGTSIIYSMNSAEALDMLRLAVEDQNGDIHITRLACMAIRSGAVDLPHNDAWPNVIDL